MEIVLIIDNKAGLHARPAALFTKTAAGFNAAITVRTEVKSANAKSIIGLMGLGVKQGQSVTVVIEGDDAEAAAAALQQLVADNFGEA